jgi:hypothetical protein
VLGGRFTNTWLPFGSPVLLRFLGYVTRLCNPYLLRRIELALVIPPPASVSLVVVQNDVCHALGVVLYRYHAPDLLLSEMGSASLSYVRSSHNTLVCDWL